MGRVPARCTSPTSCCRSCSAPRSCATGSTTSSVIINRAVVAGDRAPRSRRSATSSRGGGRQPAGHPHRRVLALAAGHRGGRHRLPAAAPQRGPGGEPAGVRAARPALRGAVGVQPAARRDAHPRDRCCPRWPRRPPRRCRPGEPRSRWPSPGSSPSRRTGARTTRTVPTRRSCRCDHGGATLGSIAVCAPPRPRAPALRRTAAGGPRRPGRRRVPQRRPRDPARRRTSPSSTAPPGRSPTPAPGSSRPTTPYAGPSRRRSRGTWCRTWSGWPASCDRARDDTAAVAGGRRRAPGHRRQHRAGGAAGPHPRRVPHPARAVRDRAGPEVVPGPRPTGASPCTSTPPRRGRRFPARVEAAVYFCCAEVSRGGRCPQTIELALVDGDLVLRVARRPGRRDRPPGRSPTGSRPPADSSRGGRDG